MFLALPYAAGAVVCKLILFYFVKFEGIVALSDIALLVSAGVFLLGFMLAGVIGKFYLLKYGLSIVLIFVGLKMVWLNDAFGGKFPILYSLGFIVTVISLSVVLSLLIPPTAPLDEEAS